MDVKKQLDNLAAGFPGLAGCRESIEKACGVMAASFRAGGKLLLAGNGGSAADCEHWAGELLKGFVSTRPLPADTREKIGAELADKLQGGLPAVPLPSLVSFSTAWSNDADPGLVFAQAVLALGKPGDVFVGISTSGNSKNILHAAKVAHALGLVTVGLTGRTGGALAGLVDVCIRVPADSVHEVQQLHLPVYHCLCLMLEEEFFG